MVLAAGRGTRLGSLGRKVPKALLEIGGKPLLARHLDYLERHGVSRVVINAHHRAGRIRSFARTYEGRLDVVCLVEEQLLGTAGGVRNALSHLQPGPFLVLYGDVLIQEPLDPMLELHRDRQAIATLAVHEANSAEGKGVVEVDETDRVTRFAEKDPQTLGPALVNSGIYVLETEFVAPLAPGEPSDFGRDVFPDAVKSGSPVFAYRLAAPVIDIGTPEGLSLARASLRAASTVSE